MMITSKTANRPRKVSIQLQDKGQYNRSLYQHIMYVRPKIQDDTIVVVKTRSKIDSIES